MREPGEAAKAQSLPATAPAPQSAPAKPAAAERSPEDSAAWQRWERAAERMRDVGGKVRESKDPLRLEVEVGNVTNEAAQSLAANGFRMLGGGGAQVTIFDATGKAIALASADGVKRP
jgi:hypothetical protein